MQRKYKAAGSADDLAVGMPVVDSVCNVPRQSADQPISGALNSAKSGSVFVGIIFLLAWSNIVTGIAVPAARPGIPGGNDFGFPRQHSMDTLHQFIQYTIVILKQLVIIAAETQIKQDIFPLYLTEHDT